MPTFRDPKDLERYLKAALDRLQAETLITTQAELGSTRVSPVDTGRFRASWFAAEGSPSGEVAPEADVKAVRGLRRRQKKRDAKNAEIQALGEQEGFSQSTIDSQKSKAGTSGLGSYSPQDNARGLRVDSEKTYHLTNNLPYAQSVAIEGKVVSKPANWFIDFTNVRVPRIQEAAARVVKREFEL
jgi:hypothetical protein